MTTAFELRSHAYGKQQVRSLFVAEVDTGEGVADFTVSTLVRGGFDACFIAGNNASVVTSDALRNVALFAIARHFPATVEDAVCIVVEAVRAQYPFIVGIEVDAEETLWRPTGRGFVQDPGYGERARASSAAPGDISVVSSFEGLDVFLARGSRFTGFMVDAFTPNLPQTDRPLRGVLGARWSTSRDGAVNGRDVRFRLRHSLLESFGSAHSESVQHLLTMMGARALEDVAEVASLTLRMDNAALTRVDGDASVGTRIYLAGGSAAAHTEATVARVGSVA